MSEPVTKDDLDKHVCDECYKEITQDDHGRYVCGCGAFRALCDVCGRPHNGEGSACTTCFNAACDKENS